MTGPGAQGTLDPIMGLRYASIVTAPADVAQLQVTVDNAAADATYGRRALVIIPAGTFGPITLYTRNYVDIRGASTNPADTVLTSDNGSADPLIGDVVWQTGSDSILGHMTLRHTNGGGTAKYAQHFDATLGGQIEATHVNIVMESSTKQPVGIGMHAGQSVFYYDCVFHRTSGGGSGGVVNWHNFNGALTAPTVCVFDGCEAFSDTTGNGFEGLSFATGQADKVYWKDGSISDGAGGIGDVSLTGTTDVTYYVSPGAYSSYNPAGQAPVDIAGQTVPVPLRMPTRY